MNVLLTQPEGWLVLMSEYPCSFLRMNLSCKVVIRVGKTVQTSLHSWEQVVWLFLCLPACWWMFVISGDIGIRLAFIETYHMLGRMLAWKWGLHQPLIPGWSLNVLLETDSWAARLHLRFRRPQEMKQCFPYLPDLRNCLELSFKLRIPRSFQSFVELESPVGLTSALVFLEDLEECWNRQESSWG